VISKKRFKLLSLPMMADPISSIVVQVDDVSFMAREVLIHLLCCAKIYNLALPVYPSVATLQEWFGCSERTIYRKLQELVAAGYIDRKEQDRKGKGRFATVRTVLTDRVAAITDLPYDPKGRYQ
jgi:hypothetical protein